MAEWVALVAEVGSRLSAVGTIAGPCREARVPSGVDVLPASPQAQEDCLTRGQRFVVRRTDTLSLAGCGNLLRLQT